MLYSKIEGGDKMLQKNESIRNAILDNNLRFWQIAEKLNLSDGNFSRLLRKELTKEKKEEVLKIIKELKEEEKNGTF